MGDRRGAEASAWPEEVEALTRLQERLGRARPDPWSPSGRPLVGGCFVCFPRGLRGPGAPGDRAWAAAALVDGGRVRAVVVEGRAGAAYRPGLLALREGRLLARALRALRARPSVVLVNATGRDHPRRAGLALQLGAALDVPTAGVTDRPLLATGEPPPDEAGARSPLRLGDERVGFWLRAEAARRALAVHAAWRTTAESALAAVLASAGAGRTPEPLRQARRAAREARSRAAEGTR